MKGRAGADVNQGDALTRNAWSSFGMHGFRCAGCHYSIRYLCYFTNKYLAPEDTLVTTENNKFK